MNDETQVLISAMGIAYIESGATDMESFRNGWQARQPEIDELRAVVKQCENVLQMQEAVVLVYDPTVYGPIKQALAAARAVLEETNE